MTDTGATAGYEFVGDAIIDVVESGELSRHLKDRIYQTTEEREDVTLDQAGEVAQAVEARYLDTRVDPLDPTGTVSAQSIGEPGTQMAMNTFHYAGVIEIDITQGLPRLIELMDVRKTPDTLIMTVYPEDEYASNRELAHRVVWNIESTKILVLSDISVDVTGMVVQVNLNDETLLEHWPTYDDRGVAANEIAETVEDALDVKTRREGTLIESGPESPSCRRLLQFVEELRDVVFEGIGEVSRVVIREENNEDTDEEKFALYTEGSALGDVLAIEGVDASRTTPNDVHEVHKQPGVETAREAIIDETMDTLYRQGLNDMNVRHLMLTADIMTNGGTIESVGRHGTSGSKDSALARAAFEVTVDHLLDAAIHGEEDNLDGVIENVIVGRPIAIGTGDVDLRMGLLDVKDADANAAPELPDD